MKLSQQSDFWKVTGGTLIVVAAVCIMLPDLLNYLGGLGRMALWVAAVIAVATLFGLILSRIKSHKTPAASKNAQEKST